MSKRFFVLIAALGLIVVSFQNCGNEKVTADVSGTEDLLGSNGERMVRMFHILEGQQAVGEMTGQQEEPLSSEESLSAQADAEDISEDMAEMCEDMKDANVEQVDKKYIRLRIKVKSLKMLEKRAENNEAVKERLKKRLENNPELRSDFNAAKETRKAVRICYKYFFQQRKGELSPEEYRAMRDKAIAELKAAKERVRQSITAKINNLHLHQVEAEKKGQQKRVKRIKKKKAAYRKMLSNQMEKYDKRIACLHSGFFEREDGVSEMVVPPEHCRKGDEEQKPIPILEEVIPEEEEDSFEEMPEEDQEVIPGDEAV